MTNTAIADAMNELAAADKIATMPVSKKKPRKAKTEQANAKPKEEPKEKPAPITFKGFEVAEGANLETIAAAEKEAQEAIDAITNKETDLLGHYVKLGQFQSEVSGMFKSTKLYGQYLKAELPASQMLDAALRSNCKWLFEALNKDDHENADLLSVLGVNRLEDFKSGNPTVIKREYKNAQKAKAVSDLAEASGVSVEEQEAILVQEQKEAKEAEKKELAELLNAFLESIAKRPTKKDVAADAGDVISEFLFSNKADALEMMRSCIMPS